MDLNLTLSSRDLDDDATQRLTRDICTTINEETNLNAAIPERAPQLGIRGDPITIGTIVLAVLGTGGGAAALINVFKSYIDRSRELSIKLTKPGGDEIEITSKNIDSEELKATLNLILEKG